MEILLTGEVYVWITVALWLGALVAAELKPIALREPVHIESDR